MKQRRKYIVIACISAVLACIAGFCQQPITAGLLGLNAGVWALNLYLAMRHDDERAQKA